MTPTNPPSGGTPARLSVELWQMATRWRKRRRFALLVSGILLLVSLACLRASKQAHASSATLNIGYGSLVLGLIGLGVCVALRPARAASEKHSRERNGTQA